MRKYVRKNKPIIHKQKSKKYCRNIDINTQEIQNMAAEEKQEVSMGSDQKRKGTGSSPPCKR